MFDNNTSDKEEKLSSLYFSNNSSNIKILNQVNIGSCKGKTGVSDHTKRKTAFGRPCTVGLKSQNQPLVKLSSRTPL